jgi:hypothetical protein
MVAPWITTVKLSDPESSYADDAIAAASFVLFHLSGRKYGGVRETTEEYCQVGLDQIGLSTYYGPYQRPPLPGPSGYAVMYPELRHGVITNRIGGMCNTCGCTHLLRLRGAPVLEVTSVKVGSGELDPSAYAIYDHGFIASPNECWNTCDDVEVTYRYGTEAPILGQIAAAALADQYILAMAGSDECELPQRVTQISRQGVSWTLLDPQEFLKEGRTGIYSVDLFLAVVNPDSARLRPRVFSPDVPRARTKHVGGPAPAPPAPGGLSVGPQAMTMQAPPMPTQFTFAPAPAPATSTTSVTTYAGQPLIWTVPGPFTQESPPRIVVLPSHEQVPADALVWRTDNFTLDLTSEQVERLLPPGSVLLVSATGEEDSTTAQANYSVERSTS